MIGRCSHDSQHGKSVGILWMLAILISGTQITTKATGQPKDTNWKNEQEKTTEMYFPAILKSILQKENIEKEC